MKRVIMNEMKTVSDQISDAVEAGTAENATIAELASSIKQAIADVGEQYKNQSVTIARTETGIISSKQRFETFKDIGAEYKQWINAHDEKVRDSHRDGTGDGGKIIGINDIFPSTGLMYPLEAGGAAGEVINCRCSLILVSK
jgi:SPP1 gp7 family putative phage head morphogenesis protein